MHEANALLTIDDERGWAGDIQAGNAKAMVDPITLDHGAVGIDEDRDREPMGLAISRHFRGALADDHQDLRTQGLVLRKMGLQLIQLLAASRSPCPADKHEDHRFGLEDVAQLYFSPFARAQRESWSFIAKRQS